MKAFTQFSMISLLILSPVSWAAGTFGDWKVSETTDHPIWHKAACVAQTSTSGSTLELYAEKDSEQNQVIFNDPTIQVVTPKGFPTYVRGILTDGKTTTKFYLMLAANTETPTRFGLMARAGERKLIADFLKKSSTAKITFVNDKNVAIKSLVFSLRGSTKAIDDAVKTCGLTLQ